MELSRSQIAQSLGSKDPTWFRQTADRGVSSAAYRKNQEAATPESWPSTGTKLPGMSRESTAEAEQSPAASTTPSEYARAAPLSGQSQDAEASSNRQSSDAPGNIGGGLGQPVPLSAQRSSETLSRSGSNRLAMSPSQGQLGNDRPPSPTKGLGGFVQSAMMKRSDSVKRWSTNPTPTLKRGDSIASNRGGAAGIGIAQDRGSSSPREKKPDSPLVSPNGEPSERQNESKEPKESSTIAATHTSGRLPLSASSSTASLSGHNRVQSKTEPDPETIPTSPSKTMDPRRWSPTKSSWLESALNKPDSPQIKSPPAQQPSWMTEIHKTKQAKADGDEPKRPRSPSKEIQTPSLLRSPAIGGHSRPLSISGLPESFSTGSLQNLSRPASPVKVSGSRTPSPTKEFSHPPAVKGLEDGISLASKQQSIDLEVAENPDERPIPTAAESSISTANRSSVMKPELKPKPQTPQTDFRAGLKPRPTSNSDNSNQSAEDFRNVVGTLKRTKTQNYKAPDTFKDNILAGKSALNATGGPKKSARVDEFKDSLLKRKEEMKVGGGSIRAKAAEVPAPRKPSNSVPEALLKRNTLGRSDSMKGQSTTESGPRQPWKPRNASIEKPAPETPQASSNSGPLKWSERQALAEKARAAERAAEAEAKAKRQAELIAKAEAEYKDAMAKAGETNNPTPNQPGASRGSLSKSSSSGSGKLADRLNPALLAVLSRQHAPRANESSEPIDDKTIRPVESRTPSSAEPPSGEALTHATKGRAKGPKRRLPNASKSQPTSESKPPRSGEPEQSEQFATSPKKPESVGGKKVEEQPPTESVKPAVDSPKQSAPRPLADVMNERARQIDTRSSTSNGKTDVASPKEQQSSPISAINDKPKPKVAVKSPELRKVSSITLKSPDGTPTSPAESFPRTPIAKEEKPVGKQTDKPVEKPIGQPPPKVEDSASSDPEQRTQPSFAARFGMWSTGRSPSSSPQRTDSPGPRGPRPPVTKAKPVTETSGPAPPSPQKSLQSPTKPSPPSSHPFALFFETSPSTSAQVEVDPQPFLSSPDTEPIRTTLFQITSMTGDGKTAALPPGQEYILYAESMYVILHEYFYPSQPARKEVELNLWTGSLVPQPAIDDAQVFARKIARDHSAKMVHVLSGKEPAKLYSALGGIGVFRHNSQQSPESSNFILRARRHHSHMSFDEVKFHPSSLCSGFCYILSTKGGKLWLWKGKGATTDELGTARLIGMNLTQTGEIEEVQDGDEPTAFFNLFPSGAKKAQQDMEVSSIHWGMRARHENYATRLFRVDHEARRPSAEGWGSALWGRRSSSAPATPNIIRELSPFSQHDLQEGPPAVFILDAWFEIYM